MFHYLSFKTPHESVASLAVSSPSHTSGTQWTAETIAARTHSETRARDGTAAVPCRHRPHTPPYKSDNCKNNTRNRTRSASVESSLVDIANLSVPQCDYGMTDREGCCRVPKCWAYGSVCCACAQRPGLPRQSFSRTLRSPKHNIFRWANHKT